MTIRTALVAEQSPALRTLPNGSMEEAHATLCKYKTYEACNGNVVELIGYTSTHTPCCKRMVKLRELVTPYVTFKQIQIVGSDPCLSSIEDDELFARDPLSIVL